MRIEGTLHGGALCNCSRRRGMATAGDAVYLKGASMRVPRHLFTGSFVSPLPQAVATSLFAPWFVAGYG
jgi:hypothetical protein